MSMIERVARAIDPLAWESDGPIPTRADTVDWHQRRQDSNAKAIAVLEAMLEPSSQMLHAAAKAMSPGRRPTPERVSVQQKHRIRYRAMIMAALPLPPSPHS